MADNDGGLALHGPFNLVRAFSARMGTTDDGIRALILQLRFETLPGGTAQEATFLLDEALQSKLAARLTELSERERPLRH